jgi:TPR repeat protein
MGLVARTDADLQKEPRFARFYEAHQTELHDKASAAAHQMLANYESGAPVPQDAEAEGLLHEFDAVAQWLPPAEAAMFRARVGMPFDTLRRNYAAALRLFLDASKAGANVTVLQREFDAALAALFTDFREDHVIEQQAEVIALLKEIPPATRQAARRVALLEGWLAAEEARRGGRVAEALQRLIDVSKTDAQWGEEVKPDAVALVESFRQRPPEDIRASTRTLIAASQQWKLDAPFMLLGGAEPESRQKWDYYREAMKLGNVDAKAEVGGYYFYSGLQVNDQAAINEGLRLLKEAAAAGNSQGVYLLANAYFEGRGVKEDAAEAARLAQQAIDKGHPDALVLLGNAQLRQAELNPSPDAYRLAGGTIEKAASRNLRGAWYSLYISRWNPTVQDAAGAAEALKSGAQAQDPNCLFTLGVWYQKGQAPLDQNLSLARDAMAKAARLGHEKARDWCRSYERTTRDTGSAADKEWVEKNRSAWKS